MSNTIKYNNSNKSEPITDVVNNSSILYLFNNNTLLSGGTATLKRYFNRTGDVTLKKELDDVTRGVTPIRNYFDAKQFTPLSGTPVYLSPSMFKTTITPVPHDTNKFRTYEPVANVEKLNSGNVKTGAMKVVVDSAIKEIDIFYNSYKKIFNDLGITFPPRLNYAEVTNSNLATLLDATNLTQFMKTYCTLLKINPTPFINFPSIYYETYEGFLLLPESGVYTFTIDAKFERPNFVINIRSINDDSNEIFFSNMNKQIDSCTFKLKQNIYYEFTLLAINTDGGGINDYQLSLISPSNQAIDIKTVIYTICDSTTLTNCKQVDINNLVLIDGMLLQRYYEIDMLSSAQWRANNIAVTKNKKLIKSEYSSLINFSSNTNNIFTKSVTKGKAMVLLIDGYLSTTFPNKYSFKTTYTKGMSVKMAIFVSNINKFIDTSNINMATNPDLYYIGVDDNTESKPFIIAPPNLKQKITIVLYIENVISPELQLSLFEESSSRQITITPSWLSADYNTNFSNEYRDSVMKRCGVEDINWTNTGCTDVFNKNMTNILQSKNNKGNVYSKLIMDNCNSKTPHSSCAQLYNSSSPDKDIFIDYCNKGNNYIDDPNCLSPIFNPDRFKYNTMFKDNNDIKKNALRSLEYCNKTYNNFKSDKCTSIYKKFWDENIENVQVKFKIVEDFNKDNEMRYCLSDKTASDFLNDVDGSLVCSRVLANNNSQGSQEMIKKIHDECSKPNNLFSEQCNTFTNNYMNNIEDKTNNKYYKEINKSKLNYCTDDNIKLDLVTKNNCVPYLLDETILDLNEDRIISYCENHNAYQNDLCKAYYGKSADEVRKFKQTNPLMENSISNYINKVCLKDFKKDDICMRYALADPGKYAVPAVKYCNTDDNLATEFCTQMYDKLLDTSNFSTTSGFQNKDTGNIIGIIFGLIAFLSLLYLLIKKYYSYLPESNKPKKNDLNKKTSLSEYIKKMSDSFKKVKNNKETNILSSEITIPEN